MRLDVPITDAEEAAAWIRKNLIMKCEKQPDGQYFLKAGRGRGWAVSGLVICLWVGTKIGRIEDFYDGYKVGLSDGAKAREEDNG